MTFWRTHPSTNVEKISVFPYTDVYVTSSSLHFQNRQHSQNASLVCCLYFAKTHNKTEMKGLKGLWVPQNVLFCNNSIHLKLFLSGYPGIWISPP